MRRLNVGYSQLEACVQRAMFALPRRPRIDVGEVLLLQLNKRDWQLRGNFQGRIEYALVFQRAEHDLSGAISMELWPDAGKVFPWILYASAVLPAVNPFSLEDLPLQREKVSRAT